MGSNHLERLAESFLQMPEKLARIVEAHPDAIIAVAADGRVEYVNRAAELLTGWHRHVLVGQTVEVLLPEELRSQHATLHRPMFLADPSDRPMRFGRPLHLVQKLGGVVEVTIQLTPIMQVDGLMVVAYVRRVRA